MAGFKVRVMFARGSGGREENIPRRIYTGIDCGGVWWVASLATRCGHLWTLVQVRNLTCGGENLGWSWRGWSWRGGRNCRVVASACDWDNDKSHFS